MLDFVRVISWLVILIGALRFSTSAPVLYMLLAGQVEPGDSYFLDELAPTTTQAFIDFAIDSSIILSGIMAIYLARRHVFNKTLKMQTSVAVDAASGAP